MNARELKNKYIEFFVSKGHVEIPSASLVPENDPTTLFISAGMHPLVPYLLGQPHPLGKRITDVQKSVRTGDIDEVGDTYHHTFFEMLGNWSLGDYFKKEAIEFSYEFLTKVLSINPNNLFATYFAGNETAPKDDLSASVWKSLNIPDDRVVPLTDNWWGPAGATGPCGPDSEMFVDTRPELPPVDFKTGDKQGRYLEIWNDVFMEYNKKTDNSYQKLSQQNVDTGMGVERTVAVLNGFADDYLTSIWQPIIKKIEELSKMDYGIESDDFYIKDDKQCWVDVRKSMRIIADHIRSAVFIIADDVEPANKEAGYVLRRLIRRSIRQGKLIGINTNFCSTIGQSVLGNQDNYAGIYPELDQNKEKILSILDNEENKFRKTLDRGLTEINKLITRQHNVSGKEAFDLYQSYGFPVEMVEEELSKNKLTLDKDEFLKYKDEHQKLSQTLSSGKFKSGLADQSEIITKYHTATHLLHASLRKILGTHVQQSGSNITSERLRFDFSHPEKLTDDQLKQVETMVNEQINRDLKITCDTLPFIESQKQGALAFFGSKYPETVTMYTMGDFSKEVCTGPHVEHTSTLGKFKIQKEESASAGKRRIYAVLE
ncbi:alanine--tRNA ligase [Candidatus Shapirobacteria bacterium]|nr:alanine--tRNA ligase [Candidatus Shapirobacteria bacterium]